MTSCPTFRSCLTGLVASVFVSLVSCRTPQADEVETAFKSLPSDYVVFAVGTSGGTQPLNLQIDNSGSDASQADVIVNVADRPVVLVLTGSSPIVWSVGRTKDTRLVGVVVSGYNTQLVSGLAKETPRLISTSEQQGKFAPFHAHGATEELLAMNEAVRRLVGKEIHRFEFKPKGRVFYVGEQPPEGTEIVYGEQLDLTPYRDPNRRLAGHRGIEQLINEGKLRLAKREDIDAWVAKSREKHKQQQPDPNDENHLRVGWTYVVLKSLTLPDGMYGAHSRSFIIPLDAPFPDGPTCHNEFYLMDGTKNDPFTPAFGRPK
jgi:hypothetical protein